VFEDWKRAWREAVENFRRELNEPESAGEPAARVRAMEREIRAARDALRHLDEAIEDAAREARAERESERVCVRREKLAAGVGDAETVRLAAEYAARHAERAGVLERKSAVLREERTLLGRDLEAMERVFDAQPKPAPEAGAVHELTEQRKREDRDFSKLEREAREKAASERLEELKRKLR